MTLLYIFHDVQSPNLTLWRPGIDSKDSIQPAFVSWRAITILTLFVVPARQAIRRLEESVPGLLERLQIGAQKRKDKEQYKKLRRFSVGLCWGRRWSILGGKLFSSTQMRAESAAFTPSGHSTLYTVHSQNTFAKTTAIRSLPNSILAHAASKKK
jgi:hypothetical protein